jgi:hypothetical protein
MIFLIAFEEKGTCRVSRRALAPADPPIGSEDEYQTHLAHRDAKVLAIFRHGPSPNFGAASANWCNRRFIGGVSIRSLP